MRGLIAWMLFGVLALAQAAALDRIGTARVARRASFLDELLGALAGNKNNGNAAVKTVTQKETVTTTMMKTVTVNNAATGNAGGAPFGNQSTVTVTQIPAAGVAAGVSQLMIVTTTVFGSGAAPTVTITALASTVTQTVCNNNAVANPNGQMPAVVSGSTSNQGIVIVSLPGTTGPTTTFAQPAATSAVSSVAPIQSVATSAGSSLAAPSVAVPTGTASTSAAAAVPPAAETSLSSSIALGLISNTGPTANQPAVTTAPAEAQNPAAASGLSLSPGVSLASVLSLGALAS